VKDPVTIQLADPISVMGESRNSLVLKPLTGGMLARAGSYMRIVHQEGAEGVEILPAGILKLIAASANIPLRSAEMLSAPDYHQAQAAIIDFLGMNETETAKTVPEN